MKTIQKSDFFKVALAAIVVEDGFNVRKDMGDLDALAQSIAEMGQQNPIIASKMRGEDKFLLTAGHRRLAAIKLANEKFGADITHVNVMNAKADPEQRVLTMLLDGEGSKKLSASEMAAGFARLKEMGLKPQEMGQKVGLSQAQVYNILAVNKAPEAIKEMIERGEISVALVNQIQREAKDDPAKQVELAKEAVENAKESAPAKDGTKKKATASNSSVKKLSLVDKLEEALSLAEGENVKTAFLESLIIRLKGKADPEEIAKLLK